MRCTCGGGSSEIIHVDADGNGIAPDSWYMDATAAAHMRSGGERMYECSAAAYAVDADGGEVDERPRVVVIGLIIDIDLPIYNNGIYVGTMEVEAAVVDLDPNATIHPIPSATLEYDGDEDAASHDGTDQVVVSIAFVQAALDRINAAAPAPAAPVPAPFVIDSFGPLLNEIVD